MKLNLTLIRIFVKQNITIRGLLKAKHIFKNGRKAVIEARLPAAIAPEMTQISGEGGVAVIYRALSLIHI